MLTRNGSFVLLSLDIIAQSDMLWYVFVLCGWCGVVCGVVWCGIVWCSVVWCGVVWCGVVWCGVVWCGVVWYGTVWHANLYAL